MNVTTFGMSSPQNNPPQKLGLLRVNTSGLSPTKTSKEEAEEYKGGVDYFLSELDKQEKEKSAQANSKTQKP